MVRKENYFIVTSQANLLRVNFRHYTAIHVTDGQTDRRTVQYIMRFAAEEVAHDLS